MKPDSLAVTYVPIETINPNEYNPRKHTKEQMEQLKTSIERFGMVDPLICNNAKGRENTLIAGHFRLEVAKTLGYKEVPVIFITSLSRGKRIRSQVQSRVTSSCSVNIALSVATQRSLRPSLDSVVTNEPT